jgi:hypothetical protein
MPDEGNPTGGSKFPQFMGNAFAVRNPGLAGIFSPPGRTADGQPLDSWIAQTAGGRTAVFCKAGVR